MLDPRTAKWRNRRKNRISPLAIVAICFCLCMLWLAIPAWGWFTDSRTVGVDGISSAHLNVKSVNVYQIPIGNQGSEEGTATVSEKQTPQEMISVEVSKFDTDEYGVYTFHAQANIIYRIILDIEGNFTNGFLKVKFDDVEKYGNVWQGKSDFIINPAQDGIVTLCISWGIIPENVPMENRFDQGTAIGEGKLCLCEAQCTEAEYNSDCPVCSADWIQCQGTETTETETESVSETEPESESETESEPEIESVPETESETKTESETITETESTMESETESPSESENTGEGETTSEPKPGLEDEEESSSESGTEIESPNETEGASDAELEGNNGR